jgi:hypothetical protein
VDLMGKLFGAFSLGVLFMLLLASLVVLPGHNRDDHEARLACESQHNFDKAQLGAYNDAMIQAMLRIRELEGGDDGEPSVLPQIDADGRVTISLTPYSEPTR